MTFRFPLRAEPERLSASRPCALRADQFRDGAGGGRAASAAHRGHRRGPLPAGIRAGDLRGSGVARHRLGAAGAAPERAFRRLSRGAGAARVRLVYPSFESRGEIARLVAERERDGPWPRDPDGAPLYPGDARTLSRGRARSGASQAGEPYALRLDMAAAIARAGPLTWIETGAGPGGETGASRRLRSAGATWCWRARRRRRAITLGRRRRCPARA